MLSRSSRLALESPSEAPVQAPKQRRKKESSTKRDQKDTRMHPCTGFRSLTPACQSHREQELIEPKVYLVYPLSSFYFDFNLLRSSLLYFNPNRMWWSSEPEKNTVGNEWGWIQAPAGGWRRSGHWITTSPSDRPSSSVSDKWEFVTQVLKTWLRHMFSIQGFQFLCLHAGDSIVWHKHPPDA